MHFILGANKRPQFVEVVAHGSIPKGEQVQQSGSRPSHTGCAKALLIALGAGLNRSAANRQSITLEVLVLEALIVVFEVACFRLCRGSFE